MPENQTDPDAASATPPGTPRGTMTRLTHAVLAHKRLVTVAWVASDWRDSPRTLALDRKSESHSAVSHWASGGILAGGEAGSNVRLANATGCLVIAGTVASLSCRRDDESRHINQPKINIPSKTQRTSTRRMRNTASAFHFANKSAREPRVCAGE